MPSPITVFPAHKVITMDPLRPEATAIAVRDGRILAVGRAETIRDRLPTGPVGIDDRLRDKVVLPGFIDPHMHAQMLGLQWQSLYLGYYDRHAPDGALVPGSRSLDEVIARLGEAASTYTGSTPLTAWGFDPSQLDGVGSSARWTATLTAAHMDRVTGDVPVVVTNMSGHLSYVNSALMRLAGITAETEIEGVIKDERGHPTGELRELRAMQLAQVHRGPVTREQLLTATLDAARMAHRAGCTTASDWAFGLYSDGLDAYVETTLDDACPVRFVLAPFSALLRASAPSLEGSVEVYRRIQGAANERLTIGPVKLMVDGSIQGFTALLRWPGYHNGAPNGMANTTPDELRRFIAAFHREGFQVTIHTNGDLATEHAIDAIEGVLGESPRPDHRHRLEHLQMATTAQLVRMARLGIGGVLFPVHLYYWGDFHYAQTLGPDRAERMNAAASAARAGVRFSFHSDAPVTPVGPLFSAWCAVNRLTARGRVLGDAERIPVADALRAITLDAAWLLHQDADKGSIEVGKLADFTVLDADPLAAAPIDLKDIPIWGTVLGGRVHPIEEPSHSEAPQG